MEVRLYRKDKDTGNAAAKTAQGPHLNLESHISRYAEKKKLMYWTLSNDGKQWLWMIFQPRNSRKPRRQKLRAKWEDLAAQDKEVQALPPWTDADYNLQNAVIEAD